VKLKNEEINYIFGVGVACIFKFTFCFADIILPVLNSSLDNPIATSSCKHDPVHTGSGDFEFRDVLEDVSCMNC